MGDPRRFDKMATLIESEFGFDHTVNIADVAGGKGYMRMALLEKGFTRITTIDKRRENAKGRPGRLYGHFNYETSPPNYNLVIGMHPDEGTDHIICYAGKYKIPFVVCPCCIKPSATVYRGQHKFSLWVDHLLELAHNNDYIVEEHKLKMQGRNLVLIGRPKISLDMVEDGQYLVTN